MMNDNGALGRTWEEVRSELFTPEEIAESNMRVALMKQLVLDLPGYQQFWNYAKKKELHRNSLNSSAAFLSP